MFNTKQQIIRNNTLIKLGSKLLGVGIPAASCALFVMLSLGPWDFSNSVANCYAVEFPNLDQFKENPSPKDPTNFIGLKVVNVSDRLNTLVLCGIGIELGMVILWYLSITGVRYEKISRLLSVVTLVWFFMLIRARFDHFGKVCGGDFMADPATSQFKELAFAGFVVKLYIWSILGCSGLFFVSVLIYTVMTQPMPVP